MAEYRRIKVLIPAAGESIRYQSEGYAVRKPFLTIRNKHGESCTMLEHVMRLVPRDVQIWVAVPEGYTAPDWDNVRVRVVEMKEQTSSHSATVAELAKRLDSKDSALVVDADVICPVAGMLEWIEHVRPPAAIACSTLNFQDDTSRLGTVSMRYFRSVPGLRNVLLQNPTPDMDTAIELVDHAFERYHVPWFEDWGTPEKLAKNGASVA